MVINKRIDHLWNYALWKQVWIFNGNIDYCYTAVLLLKYRYWSIVTNGELLLQKYRKICIIICRKRIFQYSNIVIRHIVFKRIVFFIHAGRLILSVVVILFLHHYDQIILLALSCDCYPIDRLGRAHARKQQQPFSSSNNVVLATLLSFALVASFSSYKWKVCNKLKMSTWPHNLDEAFGNNATLNIHRGKLTK